MAKGGRYTRGQVDIPRRGGQVYQVMVIPVEGWLYQRVGAAIGEGRGCGYVYPSPDIGRYSLPTPWY